MDKNTNTHGYAALFVVQLAIALLLFVLDISLGPGIADGIGYSIVLVLCLRHPKPLYALGWAGFSSLLIIAAGIVSPPPGDDIIHAALINRTLEIATIWVVWFIIKAVLPRVE